MITRLLFTTVMLLSLSAFAAEANKAEEIFDRNCASCHTLARVMAILKPVKEQDRPAHLSTFLSTHPAKLGDTDQRLVIELLSRRGK